MTYKTIFICFFAFFLTCFNTTAQDILSDATKAEIETLANVFLQQTKTPGISIALRKNGETIYAEGFGYANVEEKIPMDANIRIRTASVAKVMTATALGILASQGKLDFDAPINKYIPYIPKAYAALTTRQLAGHTSGMEHRPKGNRYKKKQYNNIKETVLLMKSPLLFEADTSYKYSTHAYNLLGAVIEGASATTYFDFMNEAVFKPLGMTNTFVENIKSLTKKDAQLYFIKKGVLQKEKTTNGSYKVPGAGFRSTPADLVKMMDAYTNGMISKSIVSEMFKSNVLANGTKTNVGIAWRSSIDPFDNNVIEHAGSWRGARTVVVHYPQKNVHISIMINANCPVLIEETAHLFAHLIDNEAAVPSNISLSDKKIRLAINSEEGKKTVDGRLNFSSKMGTIKSSSTGFLKENPLVHLGSANNYALATFHGLLYVLLKSAETLEGHIYRYHTALNQNPTKEKPLATFE